MRHNLQPPPPPETIPHFHPLVQPKRFGEDNHRPPAIETVPGLDAAKGGRWRRLRWGLLDRTASLLDMNTLSVFTPVKTLLHAFKGNRWVSLFVLLA